MSAKSFISAALTAAALTIAGTVGAAAATLSFDTFYTTTDNSLAASPTPQVTVDDDNAGFLTFTIGSSGVAGKLSGFGFDAGNVVLGEDDILMPSAGINAYCSPKQGCRPGGGANANGTYADGTNNPKLDVVFSIKRTDVSSSPFTFKVSSDDLTLSALERVFVRFQAVGADGEGSSKLLGYPGEEVPPVPLPASVLLLAGGVGALRLLRRKA